MEYPDEFVERRYLGPVHGNGMVAEYPIILYPDAFDEAGQDGVFEANMTVCVESYLGSISGGEGVKLEEQVLLTTDGVQRLTTYPYESTAAAEVVLTAHFTQRSPACSRTTAASRFADIALDGRCCPARRRREQSRRARSAPMRR